MAEDLLQDFDSDRLARQKKFLIDRAQNHAVRAASISGQSLKKESWLSELPAISARSGSAKEHEAAAASFFRDVAVISLLQGNEQEAAEFFMVAGESYVRLGLFYGYLLLAFGDRGRLADWHNDENLPLTRFLTTGSESTSDEFSYTSLVVASARSPRQLLYLYQAALIGGSEEESFADWVEFSRARLNAQRTAFLGPTATPLEEYLAFFDDTYGLKEEGISGSRAQNVFAKMMFRRSDILATARSDHWHWLKLFSPADLVDLDLVAMCLIYNLYETQNLLIPAVLAGEAYLSLPLQVASSLRQSTTRPHFRDY
jgi:hypothetical protein